MNTFRSANKKKKVIFIMGATATRKSKISVELATHFQAEIINSDKIRFYKGLDIITNKIIEPERHGVPHHLLGFVEPEADFTVQDFCHHARMAINHIIENGHIPIIVGGSNTYIEALVEDPTIKFRSNFDCFFLWTDVSLPVLYNYVGKRVDQMVDAGLVNEVREFYVPDADYTRGIRLAIGAPEMDQYFKAEKDMVDDATKNMLLDAAIEEIKVNTCKLVDCQLRKIQRLRNELGWEIHRIDATCVLKKSGKDAKDAWEEVILRPSLKMVTHFLEEDEKIVEGKTQFSSTKPPQKKICITDLLLSFDSSYYSPLRAYLVDGETFS